MEGVIQNRLPGQRKRTIQAINQTYHSKPFYYSVQGPSLFGETLEDATWGVSATISKDFANALLNYRRTDLIEQRLQKSGEFILKEGKFPNFTKQSHTYSFHKNSCLVRAIHVPGNACDLALDEDALSHLSNSSSALVDFNYMQHNVDSFQQAVFLEVLFRRWANRFDYLLAK